VPDHRARFGKIMLDRAEAAQVPEIIDIDMPVVDLVTALAQEIADHVLARPSAPRVEGIATKSLWSRVRVETGIDGIEDFLLGIAGVHCVLVPIGARREMGRRHLDQTIFWRPVAAVYDHFQNRSRAHRMKANHGDAPMPGNRNIMYLIIGALIVAVGVLGYNLYQTKKEPEGLQINVGPSGLKIQNK